MPPKAKSKAGGSLGGAAGKGSMVRVDSKSITDTRRKFGLGVGIPGFSPGANYANQDGPGKNFVLDANRTLNIHATIDLQKTSGRGASQVRMVEIFHVSLKLDGQRNPGVFIWVYNGTSDQYIAQTYGQTNGPPLKPKTWFGDQAIQNVILAKANAIARGLKSTFGSRGITPATW